MNSCGFPANSCGFPMNRRHGRFTTGDLQFRGKAGRSPEPSVCRDHPSRFSPWQWAHNGGLRPFRALLSGQATAQESAPGTARPPGLRRQGIILETLLLAENFHAYGVAYFRIKKNFQDLRGDLLLNRQALVKPGCQARLGRPTLTQRIRPALARNECDTAVVIATQGGRSRAGGRLKLNVCCLPRRKPSGRSSARVAWVGFTRNIESGVGSGALPRHPARPERFSCVAQPRLPSYPCSPPVWS